MHVVIFSLGHRLVAVGNAATDLIIMATGIYRIRSERREGNPEEYGPLAYIGGAFALLVTALFLGALSIAW